MRVEKTQAGELALVLEDQQEIDALWVLSAHVGGTPDTLRAHFSRHAPGKGGLCEVLEPHASAVFVELSRQARLSVPREVTEILRTRYGQRVMGAIRFLPADAADDEAASTTTALEQEGEAS